MLVEVSAPNVILGKSSPEQTIMLQFDTSKSFASLPDNLILLLSNL